jgi:hypothetical protein
MEDKSVGHPEMAPLVEKVYKFSENGAVKEFVEEREFEIYWDMGRLIGYTVFVAFLFFLQVPVQSKAKYVQ